MNCNFRTLLLQPDLVSNGESPKQAGIRLSLDDFTINIGNGDETTPGKAQKWLFLFSILVFIHSSLPRLVKQRYGTELRSRTLAYIKPEISQALSSLFEEIRASDDAKILRAAVADDFRRPPSGWQE